MGSNAKDRPLPTSPCQGRRKPDAHRISPLTRGAGGVKYAVRCVEKREEDGTEKDFISL